MILSSSLQSLPISDDLALAYSPPYLPLERPEASQGQGSRAQHTAGQGNRVQYTAGTNLQKDQYLRLASPDLF